jgi:hypothetical protein
VVAALAFKSLNLNRVRKTKSEKKGASLSDGKHNIDPGAEPPVPAKKASLGQVAATMFWALCMIGKKGTWERDGVKLSLTQVIIGALIAGCLVIAALLLLVRLVLR